MPDKLTLYRIASQTILEFMKQCEAKFAHLAPFEASPVLSRWIEREHFKIYAELALFASPTVLQTWMKVKDHLLQCCEQVDNADWRGEKTLTSKDIRDSFTESTTAMVGHMRVDVGIASVYPPYLGSRN